LVVDGSDPSRYYLLERRRRELLAIGDLELARRRFAWRVSADADQTGGMTARSA
jgi:hypothetical protein